MQRWKVPCNKQTQKNTLYDNLPPTTPPTVTNHATDIPSCPTTASTHILQLPVCNRQWIVHVQCKGYATKLWNQQPSHSSVVTNPSRVSPHNTDKPQITTCHISYLTPCQPTTICFDYHPPPLAISVLINSWTTNRIWTPPQTPCMLIFYNNIGTTITQMSHALEDYTFMDQSSCHKLLPLPSTACPHTRHIWCNSMPYSCANQYKNFYATHRNQAHPGLLWHYHIWQHNSQKHSLMRGPTASLQKNLCSVYQMLQEYHLWAQFYSNSTQDPTPATHQDYNCPCLRSPGIRGFYKLSTHLILAGLALHGLHLPSLHMSQIMWLTLTPQQTLHSIQQYPGLGMLSPYCISYKQLRIYLTSRTPITTTHT